MHDPGLTGARSCRGGPPIHAALSLLHLAAAHAAPRLYTCIYPLLQNASSLTETHTTNKRRTTLLLRRTKENKLSICSPCIMKNSSEALRRCQLPHHSSLIALLVLVSIAAQGCAFTGSVFPMAQNSNINNRRARRSADAASSSTSRPNSIIHRSRPGLSRGGPAVSGGPTGPRMASGEVTGDEEEEELSFVEKFKTGWVTVIQEGDPNDLPPCPSGVSEMSKPVQVLIQAVRVSCAMCSFLLLLWVGGNVGDGI